MAQQHPGIELSPSTKTSRRRRNSAIMASTGSCGPVRAARAARCENDDVQELLLVIERVAWTARAPGMAPYPRRESVMAYVFEKPSRIIAKPCMPSQVVMV